MKIHSSQVAELGPLLDNAFVELAPPKEAHLVPARGPSAQVVDADPSFETQQDRHATVAFIGAEARSKRIGH